MLRASEIEGSPFFAQTDELGFLNLWREKMHYRTNILIALAAVLVVVGILGISIASADDQKDERGGAVFVMTNSTDRVRGNEIAMYHRAPHGDLSFVGYFPTGSLSDVDPQPDTGPQLGSGPSPTAQIFKLATDGKLPLVVASADGLGSSNSLILSKDNRCLFAVNAGSNTVSSFRVRPNGLSRVSVAKSRGVFPVSLTEFKNTLYVLNSGEAGSLAGFRVEHCALHPLDGVVSLQDLLDQISFPIPAPNEVLTTPAQASFTPDGQRLVLSIKGLDGAAFDKTTGALLSLPNGRMVVFSVGAHGELSAPVVTEFSVAAGTGGPFSFTFVDAETVIIVHANSSTGVASYTINPDNTLSLLSGPFTTSGFATCWVGSDGRFVYTASFGAPSGVLEIIGSPGQPDVNGVLNGFRINHDGTLTPVGDPAGYPYPDPGPGRSGNHAIDVRVVGRFLYFIQPRLGMVGKWTIDKNGALVDLENFGGLSPGLEPTPLAGFNPGITNFLTRCFLQDPNDPSFSPECRLGSAQGIAGF
jgi:6-phosphogluconolactonase (cycloisomerase 2 family)